MSRHFQDAEVLFDRSCFDNAGYHYGFSAECALKAAMLRIGLGVDEVEVNGRAAYYSHFPGLKRIPLVNARRLSQSIANLLRSAQFLQNRHVKMRYSADHQVSMMVCEKWRLQVREFNDKCSGI